MKEDKLNTLNLLRMMYKCVDSLSSVSSIFICYDNTNKISLYINGQKAFENREVTEVKSFKTILAIQVDNEVIVLNKYNYEIISTHKNYIMNTKKVSTLTPFALLDMHNKDTKQTRIEVYNIVYKKVIGVFEEANWEYLYGRLRVIDKYGKEIIY